MSEQPMTAEERVRAYLSGLEGLGTRGTSVRPTARDLGLLMDEHAEAATAKLREEMAELQHSTTREYVRRMIDSRDTAWRERDAALAQLAESELEGTRAKAIAHQVIRERTEALGQLAERTRELEGSRDKLRVAEKHEHLLRIAANEQDGARLRQLAEVVDERDKAEAEVARLTEALTPSGETKAAYSGEVYEPDERMTIGLRAVTWTAIKDVMALIRQRAAPEPGPAQEAEKQ